MNLILEGIVLGLTLMILLGPIFVALTQAAIQGGTRAGIAVASGVWISDFSIIFIGYFFVQKLKILVEDQSFTYWMGLAGGVVLIGFGIGTYLSKNNFDADNSHEKLTKKNYLGYVTKGFLVNTINPFTFVFWISVISTYVIGRKISNQEAILFFGTIILIIIITDTLKVLGAKFLRQKLMPPEEDSDQLLDTKSQKDKPDYINIFSKVAGVVLVIFGLVLLIRAGVV